jgi:PAS domain S-box-containing protein
VHIPERELRADMALVEAALLQAGAGLYLQDYVTGEHVWSPEARAVFGVDATFEVSTESLMKLVLPEDVPRILRLLGSVHAPESREDSYSLEFRVRPPRGEVRHLLTRASLERDEQGKVLREQGVVRDVTELHALREQLVLSQREEVLGRLAGGVAHDFNNLLTVIMSQVSLWKAQSTSQALPDPVDLEIVLDATKQAGALTRRLLTFAGQRQSRPGVHDLNELVRGVQRLLRQVAGDARTTHFELAQGLPPALVDPTQLEQVLLNLVVNARDATAAGDEIRIRTSSEVLTTTPEGSRMSPGPSVLLEVEDRGTGMKPEIARRAQEAFFTTKVQGTGLGLSTCKVILEEQQGALEIESQAGVGTTVRVRLPADPHATATPLGAPSEPQEWIGAGKRVLLAEDDPMVRDLAGRSLRGFGFEIETAPDGAAALELAEHGEFDLVVTDVIMPGSIDAQALREGLAKHLPGTPVLFVSGYAALESGLSLDQIKRPGDGFLPKPYTPITLASKLRELLGRK